MWWRTNSQSVSRVQWHLCISYNRLAYLHQTLWVTYLHSGGGVRGVCGGGRGEGVNRLTYFHTKCDIIYFVVCQLDHVGTLANARLQLTSRVWRLGGAWGKNMFTLLFFSTPFSLIKPPPSPPTHTPESVATLSQWQAHCNRFVLQRSILLLSTRFSVCNIDCNYL